MTENEIILLHDRLYEYLKGLHQVNPTFMFSFAQKPQKLAKKRWFEDNDIELSVVIWSYESYRFPFFTFIYNYDAKVWICRVHNELTNDFKNLKQTLLSLHFASTWKGYEKKLTTEKDFITTLDAFIQNEKKQIDNHSVPFQGYDLIVKLRFEAMLKFIESVKLNKKTKQNPHLPFALSRLEIVDFQGIKHLVIENIPSDVQWVFLTGENGFGKTSILRAIAKGVIGDEDFVESLIWGNHIFITGYHEYQLFFQEANKITTTIKNLDFPMAVYGISRFRYHNDPEKNPPKTLALFSDDAPLINIERILVETHRAKMDGDEKESITTFDKLKKILLSIIPQLSDIKVEYFKKEPITNRYQVRYYEKATDDSIYEPIKRNDLAAGYRSILSIIGDMMVRLSAHPNNPLDDLQGIVLIDEFDAHLHPKYQYELPKLLSDAFPKVQFIVSTHSPIPLLGVPKTANAVVLTVHRTAADGITVERLDDDIEIGRLNPNALLTSPIFGFQQLFARDATSEKIFPTDNYEDVDFMKKMKAQIQALRTKGLVK